MLYVLCPVLVITSERILRTAFIHCDTLQEYGTGEYASSTCGLAFRVNQAMLARASIEKFIKGGTLLLFTPRVTVAKVAWSEERERRKRGEVESFIYPVRASNN